MFHQLSIDTLPKRHTLHSIKIEDFGTRRAKALKIPEKKVFPLSHYLKTKKKREKCKREIIFIHS